jgi:hypothetical protein
MTIAFSTLAILLPAAIMLHVTEEFFIPGGFIKWYKEFVPPKKAEGSNPEYLVWINTLMMGACMVPLYLGSSYHGVSVWYAVAAIAAANALFHVWGVLKMKKYSPGVITGVILYLPLFIVGTQQLVTSGILSLTKALIFISAAIGYHIFSVIRQGK